MKLLKILSKTLLLSYALSQYDYSLENLNSTTQTQKLENISGKIKIYNSLSKIIDDSTIFVVLTEWEQFRDLEKIDNNKIIYDFRNFLKRGENIIRF